jgi:DNA-binding CsgD family transcriptional regulator
MKSAKLPAGLEDQNMELYVYRDELKATFNGKKVLFIELPEPIKEAFEVEMIADKVAFKSLQEDMKVLESNEMLIQYVKCNYGGYDFNPDYDAQTGTMKREYWDCGCHGKCPAEGKVCKMPAGEFGTLTPRELQITILVANGEPDKLIAHQLDITINTVRSHLENIRRKVGAYTRTDITQFAIKKRLIQF